MRVALFILLLDLSSKRWTFELIFVLLYAIAAVLLLLIVADLLGWRWKRGLMPVLVFAIALLLLLPVDLSDWRWTWVLFSLLFAIALLLLLLVADPAWWKETAFWTLNKFECCFAREIRFLILSSFWVSSMMDDNDFILLVCNYFAAETLRELLPLTSFTGTWTPMLILFGGMRPWSCRPSSLLLYEDLLSFVAEEVFGYAISFESSWLTLATPAPKGSAGDNSFEIHDYCYY